MKNITDMPARKPRRKQEIADFLADHKRYHTMNSWNNAHSYAVTIKISGLNLTRNEQGACYEMLDVEDAFDESGFNHVLREFDREHDWRYQIGTNGRSGGYLVLYQGGRKPSGYLSFCSNCGQKNFQKAEADSKCGVCGHVPRTNFEHTHTQIFSMPGRGLDDDAPEWIDWDLSRLRDRLELVWAFDRACEMACRAFRDFAVSHAVEERTVHIPKTIKVAVEA